MKSGYKDSLDQYKDLVNQPTWADGVGDAFSSAGKGSAKHPEDHQANALLSGIGGGFKGAANEQRRDQLSPMLEQAGQITAKAAEIEAQTQIATQSKMQVTQLFQQTAVPIAQLSQASLAGDINASNQLAKGVYARFKQGLGDHSMGDFDHYHNGVIYYENPESGVIEGRNIIGLMYQAGINPVEIWGQDAPMIEAGLSAGAKKNYEDSEKMRQMEMQGKQADIANKYSQVNYHNAQAGKLENEMNNPPMSEMDKFDRETTRKSNEGYLKDLSDQIETKQPKLKIEVLEKMKGLLEDGGSEFGGTPYNALVRTYKKAVGDDADITEANILQKYFFPDIKGVAGNPNIKEWEDLISKIISGTQNVDAALNQIDFEINQAEKTLNKYDNYRHVISDTKHAFPYYHPEIDSRIKQRSQRENTNIDKSQGNQGINDNEIGIKWQ